MEKARNSMKVSAICILVLTLFRLATSIITFITGGVQITDDMLALGIEADLLHTILVATWVISLIAYLPNLYLGLKGLKVAKTPDNSKAHIVWAVILLVFNAIALLSALGQLSKSADMTSAVLEAVQMAISVLLYIFYIAEAKKIRAGVECA